MFPAFDDKRNTVLGWHVQLLFDHNSFFCLFVPLDKWRRWRCWFRRVYCDRNVHGYWKAILTFDNGECFLSDGKENANFCTVVVFRVFFYLHDNIYFLWCIFYGILNLRGRCCSWFWLIIEQNWVFHVHLKPWFLEHIFMKKFM